VADVEGALRPPYLRLQCPDKLAYSWAGATIRAVVVVVASVGANADVEDAECAIACWLRVRLAGKVTLGRRLPAAAQGKASLPLGHPMENPKPRRHLFFSTITPLQRPETLAGKATLNE